MDEIGRKLTELQRHLDTAGMILGQKGPETLNQGSDERGRLMEAVGHAWVLSEELLGDTGNIDPVTGG
jgi:hypothetical protein